MKIELSKTDKSMMREALLQAAIRTRGMSDEQIKAEYEKIQPGRDFDPEADDLHPGKDSPAPEGEGEAKAPSKRKARGKAKGNGKGQPEKGEAGGDAGEAGGEGESKAEGEGAGESEKDESSLERDVRIIAEKVYADAEGKGGAPEIDAQAIIDLIAKHGNTPQRIEYDVNIIRPEGEEIKIESAHPKLAQVLDIITSEENCYLVGPAGSGKTTLAAQAAKALKTEFEFTGSVADKYELIGFVDANGKYHETPLYRACVNGGVFLFDEMDGSIPTACNYFNACLENGYINFPDGTHCIIDRSKTFFIGAGNTVGKGPDRQYVGRYPLDEAFLDRFEQIDMEYDHAIEISMAESAWLAVAGDPDKIQIARDWAAEVQAFRKQLDDRSILALVSPRATRRGAKWLAKGWTIEQVRQGLYKHLSDDILAALGVSRNG